MALYSRWGSITGTFWSLLPLYGTFTGGFSIIQGLWKSQRKCVLHGLAGFIVNLCLAIILIPHLPSFWEPRPFCHKQVQLSMDLWKEGNKIQTNGYPNVSGLSSNSLVSLNRYSGGGWGGAYVLTNYKYVPGLKEDDPDELVLMYFDKPTRCTWHADSPTFSRPRKWVVVPPGFYFRGFDSPHNGECSDWIDTTEFKIRLQKTLDFLKDNDRPFWTNVVAEHTEFLRTIKE